MKLFENKNYSIAAAILFGVGGVGAYYFYNKKCIKSKNQSSTTTISLSKEQVIAILKEFKNELYSIYSQLSLLAAQVVQKTYGQVKGNDLKEVIIKEAKVHEQISKIEEKVYTSNGITKQSFEAACRHYQNESAEIQQLQMEMKNNLEKVLQGEQPNSECELPAFLNASKTLDILKDIMYQSVLKMKTSFASLRNANEEISFENPKLVEQLGTVNVENIKKNILIENNLHIYDAPPNQIIQHATTKYVRENPKFLEEMQKLEQIHQQQIGLCMENPYVTNEQLKVAFDQITL